jgi:hypothetical protein
MQKIVAGPDATMSKQTRHLRKSNISELNTNPRPGIKRDILEEEWE